MLQTPGQSWKKGGICGWGNRKPESGKNTTTTMNLEYEDLEEKSKKDVACFSHDAHLQTEDQDEDDNVNLATTDSNPDEDDLASLLQLKREGEQDLADEGEKADANHH